MAKWIRRRFPEPKIVGSSPIWDVLPGCCICFFVRGAGTASTVAGACSVMVIIGASQALDPGSIPGRRRTGALAQSEECVLCKHEVRGSKPRCSILRFSFVFLSATSAGDFQRLQAWMAERSKALDSSSSLSWRRGFESHSKHLIFCFSIRNFVFWPRPLVKVRRGALV